MLHRRVAVLTLATLGAVGWSVSPAHAEPTQIGFFFGPRVYSNDSLLGYIDDAPKHPMLENSIELGARAARPFFPWLVPEVELGFAPTSTTPTGAPSVGVYWLEPRIQLRFELLPAHRVQPFLVIGGGSPITLSTAKRTFETAIVGDGYAGAGVRFDTLKRFTLRLDARLSVLPGVDHALTTEVDISIGIELHLGERHRPTDEEIRIAATPKEPDRDGDGIPDSRDACPDRPEDQDGFEDQDGCPDIDNDGDGVLDIADKCPNVPETYNGFEDEDGCPDVVPPDVDALRGTIEGLLYADGETVVRDSAMPSVKKIAKTMTAHPSIKVVLIGHADDREAKQFMTAVPGQPPPDLAALSLDLSRARAEGVKNVLIGLGIGSGRIQIEGKGSEEPVSDNDKPRGRLANRRVEIKLFVPVRAK